MNVIFAAMDLQSQVKTRNAIPFRATIQTLIYASCGI